MLLAHLVEAFGFPGRSGALLSNIQVALFSCWVACLCLLRLEVRMAWVGRRGWDPGPEVSEGFQTCFRPNLGGARYLLHLFLDPWLSGARGSSLGCLTSIVAVALPLQAGSLQV